MCKVPILTWETQYCFPDGRLPYSECSVISETSDKLQMKPSVQLCAVEEDSGCGCDCCHVINCSWFHPYPQVGKVSSWLHWVVARGRGVERRNGLFHKWVFSKQGILTTRGSRWSLCLSMTCWEGSSLKIFLKKAKRLRKSGGKSKLQQWIDKNRWVCMSVGVMGSYYLTRWSQIYVGVDCFEPQCHIL